MMTGQDIRPGIGLALLERGGGKSVGKWRKGFGKAILGALAIGLTSLAAPPAQAVVIPLVEVGTFGADTLVFRGSLTGIGITEIGAITITDDGTPVGGQPGIFSGFDVDALFLDMDGLLATAGDRIFASSFEFTAGTTRPTADPTLLPNAAHPGPTFGSLDATTIDLATATLNVIDGAPFGDVNLADGFLTLGDGGILIANFAPAVTVSGTLFLLVGEVGGQTGEGVGASVEVSEIRVPEPGTLVLFGVGLAGLGYLARRRRKTT